MIIIIALLAGWFIAGLLGWFILGPFYYAQAIRNGAPFRIGDVVHILAGPHRDRVTTVYEVWPSQNMVRVDLGENARQALQDVFTETQICREES